VKVLQIRVRVPRPPKEHEVQKSIVDALRLAGCTVRETTAYKQKGPSGVDKGVPDLLVFVPVVQGPKVYIGLEVKRDGKAPLTPEQKAAVESGEYSIVWSPEQALQAVEKELWNMCVLPSQRCDRIANVLAGLVK
jgi:hypothetical protein